MVLSMRSADPEETTNQLFSAYPWDEESTTARFRPKATKMSAPFRAVYRICLKAGAGDAVRLWLETVGHTQKECTGEEQFESSGVRDTPELNLCVWLCHARRHTLFVSAS